MAEQAIELRGRSLEPAGDLLLAHLAATGPLGERREQGDRYRVQVLPQRDVVVEATCVEDKPGVSGQRGGTGGLAEAGPRSGGLIWR